MAHRVPALVKHLRAMSGSPALLPTRAAQKTLRHPSKHHSHRLARRWLLLRPVLHRSMAGLDVERFGLHLISTCLQNSHIIQGDRLGRITHPRDGAAARMQQPLQTRVLLWWSGGSVLPERSFSEWRLPLLTELLLVVLINREH